MSGVEAIAAVQVIDACIGIAKTIIDIGRAVSDAQGLPPKLRDLLEKLPVIEELLASARENFEEGNVVEDASKNAQPILKQCEQALGDLSDILKTACPKEGDNRSKRIWKGAKTVFNGRDSQVQKLLEIIRNNLKLLEQKEIYVIGDKLDELHVLQIDLSELLTAQKSDQFRKIRAWLSPPDPETNHVSARKRHEPQTGTWLLQADQYQRWKAGLASPLWLYGKPGCGKSVLCSTAIEDVRAYCESTPNVGHALFYFSFSDNEKQSYESLLRSLIVQLGWREPGLSMLVQTFEKPNATVPGIDELEKILSSSIESFDEAFILLDALDECPETGERQILLERLERLSGAPNLKILVTSREVGDVRFSMELLGADKIAIAADFVDADIHKWVSSQLLRDRKLIRLDLATKALVEKTITQKADGMFRWAYCQLQELKKLKSTRPRYVREALLSLPRTLDETYSRILSGIEEMFRKEAYTLLKWLAFARSPLTLDELAEAAIIDPSADMEMEVDVDNRGGCLTDILDILSGLVTIQGTGEDNNDSDNTGNEGERENAGLETRGSNAEDEDVHGLRFRQGVDKDSKIRLAHFSVKEYLESKRILQSDSKMYFLESATEHKFLTQSCLTYLMHYSSSAKKTSTVQDLIAFPLLEYAARSWYYHASLQHSGQVHREMSLLSSAAAKQNWLLVHQPDGVWRRPFQQLEDTGSGLYYASFIGLEPVVIELIKMGADINAQGGENGNALYAASIEGHTKVVKMLIDAGADINAQGKGLYVTGNALQGASERGYEKVVKVLIDAGADIDTQKGYFSNALYEESERGHEKVVKMLLDAGADVNARGGWHNNALYAATIQGFEKVMKMLLDVGADANTQGEFFGTALQAASHQGYEKAVEMLIDAGANVNAQGGCYGTALEAASHRGHQNVVEILVANGVKLSKQ